MRRRAEDEALRSPRAAFAEAADLYRVPLWLLEKPIHAFAPVTLQFRLAALGGRLEGRRSPERTTILKTLERHLGPMSSEPELRRIALRHFEFRGKVAFARLWPQVRGFAGAEDVRVEGLHHLDDALERGKGAILVSAHFGFSRLIKPILRLHGRRTMLVGYARPGRRARDLTPSFTAFGSFVHTSLLRLPRASRFDERWRATVGEDLDVGLNVHPHVAALARNETLIILADGRGARSLRPFSVLGVQVELAPGAVNLARSTGAVALPTFVVDDPDRTGPESLRLVIRPPLDLQVTDDRRADLEANLRGFASVYEEQIRAYPHDFRWTWVHDGTLDLRGR